MANDDYQQVYPKLIEARGTLAGPVGAPSGRLAQIYQESVRHEYTIIPQYLYHS